MSSTAHRLTIESTGTVSAVCRFCAAPLQHTLVDLGLSPLCQSQVHPDHANEPETFYPLAVRLCGRCFLGQLDEYVSPQTIFSEYAYFSSYSDSWVEHARAYVDDACQRLGLGAQSRVVEIGSNDGYLLQHFVARGVPVLGCEPAGNVARAAEAKGVPTVNRFFGRRAAREIREAFGAADLIVANNVLAHVPDLNDVVQGIRILLAPSGVATLEFPHLLRLIDGNQFDTIYHEHFSYFSLSTVTEIFAAHRLAVVDVEQLPTHGGSLRLHVRHLHAAAGRSGPRVLALLGEERAWGVRTLAPYIRFNERVAKTKRRILALLIRLKDEGATIVGYGAPGKGNTLLNYCGIRGDMLDYTVDRNPYKQGSLTPGTRIPIHAPERILDTRPDYVFILPWNLTDEIVAQLDAVRAWGCKFIVPIPDVRIL